MSSQKKKSSFKWRRYAFEFLTVFTGVTLAFLLNTWNEGRKDKHTERKILTEIRNGLKLDTADIHHNVSGHEYGIAACAYFRSLINNEPVPDSSANYHFYLSLRDFISIQNKSGYESLKSKGLELIGDDSLRLSIISIYDYYFQVIEKLEEQYAESQFYTAYFHEITGILAPYMVYDVQGRLIQFQQPIRLTATEKNKMLTYLYKIEFNRQFIISGYMEVDSVATALIGMINVELED